MSKIALRRYGIVLVGLIVAGGLAAAEVGRSRVVSTLGARLDYDSNIFLNNSEVSDWIYAMNGSVRMIHDVSEITTDVGVSALGQMFSDHSGQNSFDPGIDARIGYMPSDKTQLKAAADWRRNSMANDLLNARVKSTEFVTNASWEHLTTEKFGVRVSTDYHKSDYRSAGYSDVASYDVGAEAVYVYSPKLRTYAGVTWGESWTSKRAFNRPNAGGDDVRYTVGFEGELAPKVTGTVRFGLAQRDFATAGYGDESAFFIASRITWAAAEKTVWALNVDQGLNVTAADQSVKNLAASLVVTQELAERLSLEGSIGYTRANFSVFGGAGARRDNGTSARVRLNYALNENASIDASAGVRNNNSSLKVSDYQQVNVGAGFTYRF